MIYNSIIDTIANTPIVACHRLKKKLQLHANIFIKVESFNPGGSIKDRVALSMLQDAINNNTINDSTTIIEPTSGNTGIGLAMACAVMDLPCIIVMPDTMSIERQKLMKAYGAKVVLSDGKQAMQGAIDTAKELQKAISNSYIPSQFDNNANTKAHVKTTSQEIIADFSTLDFFVAGIGTGGTITGCAKTLKQHFPTIKIIGVEPLESPFLTKQEKGSHGIQGIGAGFCPSILDQHYIDNILCISTNEAKQYTRLLAKTEGVLCGISSGAALCGAIKIAALKENQNKNIVVILPDTGERYLSTDLFD